MGFVAASEKATTLAIGFALKSLIEDSFIKIIAAAPSLSVDALPAVTDPPSLYNNKQI